MSSPSRVETALPTAPERAPRRGSSPTVSVVVASHSDRGLLQECLVSLLDQCERLDAELLVVRSGSAQELGSLEKSYPSVRFIPAPAGATVSQLRAVGMREASGDVVALTEDHCVADEHWVESLTNTANGDADVVGGGVDNARRARMVDWGAYFAEYGFFGSERRDHGDGAPRLTASNVAYRRDVIDDVVRWAQEGEWDDVAHSRLVARGRMLRFARTAAVYQNQSYSVLDFCADRYQHGLEYARKRLTEEREERRWLLFAGSPLLPMLLTWRVARSAGRSRWPTFVRALPATFLFLTAWSLGEAVGYLRGASAPPPTSGQR